MSPTSLNLGVMVASGVLGTDGLGTGLSYTIQNELDSFKYIVTKSLTNSLQDGTTQPNHTGRNRYQSEGVTLNNVNLRNPGSWIASDRINKVAKQLDYAKIVASVVIRNPKDIDEYPFKTIMGTLANHLYVNKIELNLGCHLMYDALTLPKTHASDMTSQLHTFIQQQIVTQENAKKIWLKLPPDPYFIRTIVEDKDLLDMCSLVISNSYTGKIYANNIELKTNVLHSNIGVSMTTMKYINYKIIETVRNHVKDSVNIIGCGGISSAQDVQDYMLAGVNGVQIGSLFLHQPETAIAIARTFKPQYAH